MPEITLSEEQAEYLEGLREHIAEEHVGPYGHVRMREVVQFLIDRYETDEEADREAVRRAVEMGLDDRSYQDLQRLAADTDGVEPGGKAEALRERLVTARVAAVLDERPGSDATERSDDGSDRQEGANNGGSAAAGPESDNATEGDTDEPPSDGAPEADEADAGGSDDGSSRLQRMMGLLDRHDDVWEETDSDEGKYRVTLPDGSAETVRTKDDVRALLFKHYD